MTKTVEPTETDTGGNELYSQSVLTMHFDVLSCTNNIILINTIFLVLLLPRVFGFCDCPSNISRSALS